MKKLIDLDPEVAKVLKIQATEVGKDLKNYIQDHLRELAKLKPKPKKAPEWK